MAANSFPALAINTQGEGPLKEFSQIEQLRGVQQAQQMGAIQLQEAKAAQQSRTALMAAWSNNGGDFDKTLAEASKSGLVTPTDLMNFQAHAVDIHTKALVMHKDELENKIAENGIVYNALKGFQALPLEQRTPDRVKDIAGDLGRQGIDISRLMPSLQSIAKDPSDANLKIQELPLVGQLKYMQDAQEQLRLESTPTAAQAVQKNEADLNKAISEASIARQQLANLPSASEAKTARMATLAETYAKTAQANADTAEKKVQTTLLGANPIKAFDPATKQWVITTMAESQAKGYTNPIKVTDADITKEAETNRQLNDVQLNTSRYSQAFKASHENITGEQATAIERILSDKDIAGHLTNQLPQLLDSIKQGRTAESWNVLTPENRDLTLGYLRTKGSAIVFLRALAPGVRVSGEMLDLETNNIPSPLEGAGVGLKRLDAFQQNIDVASQGRTRVRGIPMPAEIRRDIESQPIHRLPGLDEKAPTLQDKKQSGVNVEALRDEFFAGGPTISTVGVK